MFALSLAACSTVAAVGCGRTNPGAGAEADSSSNPIAAGSEHTCVLAKGGVLCWGGNSHGELGYPFGLTRR
jgi:hypothetical protein